MPAAELRGYVDQLTQAGFLVRAGDQYPTLAMSDSGVALMRGQTECVLFRQPLPGEGPSAQAGAARRGIVGGGGRRHCSRGCARCAWNWRATAGCRHT